jgi:two-component system chemotaxis response regulator CheY
MTVHEAMGTRQGRVMVVDNEVGVRTSIAMVLQKAGYDVVEASDGAQEIQEIRRGDHPLMVDLVLCDLTMPNIDGTQAITSLRLNYPRVPIVVLTGCSDHALRSSVQGVGVTDYLVKPISKDTLLEVIKRATAQHVMCNGLEVA